jgi:hypothetical protein
MGLEGSNVGCTRREIEGAESRAALRTGPIDDYVVEDHVAQLVGARCLSHAFLLHSLQNIVGPFAATPLLLNC